MEQEFGNSFLKINSINHPVKLKIANTAPWQIEEMIAFTETLRYLKETTNNYKKLLEKLISEQKSKIEGIPFIEVSKMLCKEKLRIEFIEESKIQGEMRPDIQVTNEENGDKFYVEISILNNSQERKNIRDNYDFFYKEFNDVKPLLNFFGYQKDKIDKSEYTEIKIIIDGIRKRVANQNQLIFYSDKRFSFLMAPIVSRQSFNEVCWKNDIDPLNFEGMSFYYDETNRINNKIKKAKQIPKGYNGLLYISVAPLYFETTNMVVSIERLEANIKKHKNLLGIVLFANIVSIKDEVKISIGNHFFSRKLNNSLCYETLFIYNNECEVLVSQDTLGKIYNTIP